MIIRVDESNASGFPSSNLQKYQCSILKKASLVEKHKIQQYFFKQNNNDSKRVILFYNGQDRKERFFNAFNFFLKELPLLL